MTRDQIMSLKVGDVLRNTLDVVPGSNFTKLKANPAWGEGRRITEIAVRDVSDWTGKAYILGYTEHGPNGSISFSIAEGEVMYEVVR